MLRALRSVAAVIVGYLIFAIPVSVLWAVFGQSAATVPPTWFFALSIAIECGLCVLCGCLVGPIAGRAPVAHAAALGALLGLGSALMLVFQAYAGPDWPYALTIVLLPAFTLLGGQLHRRREARRAAA